MSDEWNLNKIYKGLDDPMYKKEKEELKKAIDEYIEYVNGLNDIPSVEETEHLIGIEEKLTGLAEKVCNFVGLKQSVDTKNGELVGEMNNLMNLLSSTSAVSARASKIMGKIEDIDDYASKSSLINEYVYYLKKNKENLKHLLSDAEEEMYSLMDMTGGGAWGNLQSFLTSTLKVDYEGKEVTLSEIRNLAYDKDKDVRKKAYEAELASYSKIADSVAYSLNNIKLQVSMIAGKRGFESPLAMTLDRSDMQRKTLDAMLDAIKDRLPKLRKYFLHKAKLLGYNGGLPWFELFAPLGSDDKTYSIEDTKNVLISTFEEFTPEMSGLMKEAFENEWIDFYPREGKVGGAFDSGVASIKESRVLTNFDGTFGSIDTLAHELGHSFHDRQVQDNRPLNMGYSMPVAETASTFNEIFLCSRFVAKSTNNAEKLALLESLLREQLQCIVDIYSRYLFETDVIEKSQGTFLMPDDLNKMMLDAQKKAYGEGLDEKYMNQYMWVCKSHYYSSGLSFYNFPYAFGALFATGLYSMFVEEGSEKFVPKYKTMLKATPTVTVEGAGKLMGIDLTDRKFWERSLDIIEENINLFCSL